MEELPPVLILSIKSIVFDQYGDSRKLIKKVDFSLTMEITEGLSNIYL